MRSVGVLLGSILLLVFLRWVLSLVTYAVLMQASLGRARSDKTLSSQYPEDRDQSALEEADRIYKRLMPWLCDFRH